MLQAFFLLLLAQTSLCVASPQTNYFLLDLDGTLLDQVSKEHQETYPMRIDARLDGEDYRWRDGAPEFLLSLKLIPNSFIGVFSAGTADRNEEILKKMILPNGETAYKLTTGRIFSREYAVVTSQQTAQEVHADWGDLLKVVPSAQTLTKGLGFYGDLKKIIHHVLPDAPMGRTFLIDNTRDVAARGEEKNLIDVGDNMMLGYVFQHFNFKVYLPIVERKTQIAWTNHFREERQQLTVNVLAENFYFNHNKLALYRGLIERAFENSERLRISPREAAWRLQQELKDLRLKGLAAAKPKCLEYLRIGFRKFREVNPNFHSTTLCDRALTK